MVMDMTMMSTGMMVGMVIYHLIIVIFAVSTTSADGTKLPIRDVFATVAIGVKAETYTHSEFFAFWPLRNMQALPPSLADGVSRSILVTSCSLRRGGAGSHLHEVAQQSLPTASPI